MGVTQTRVGYGALIYFLIVQVKAPLSVHRLNNKAESRVWTFIYATRAKHRNAHGTRSPCQFQHWSRPYHQPDPDPSSRLHPPLPGKHYQHPPTLLPTHVSNITWITSAIPLICRMVGSRTNCGMSSMFWTVMRPCTSITVKLRHTMVSISSILEQCWEWH